MVIFFLLPRIFNFTLTERNFLKSTWPWICVTQHNHIKVMKKFTQSQAMMTTSQMLPGSEWFKTSSIGRYILISDVKMWMSGSIHLYARMLHMNNGGCLQLCGDHTTCVSCLMHSMWSIREWWVKHLTHTAMSASTQQLTVSFASVPSYAYAELSVALVNDKVYCGALTNIQKLPEQWKTANIYSGLLCVQHTEFCQYFLTSSSAGDINILLL